MNEGTKREKEMEIVEYFLELIVYYEKQFFYLNRIPNLKKKNRKILLMLF